VPCILRLASGGIFIIDAALRRWYGVRSYCVTSETLLRIATTRAARHIVLDDGTRIAPGDPVIELHIWNERLPALGLPGRNLAWACRVKRRMQHSLHRLAEHLERVPELRGYAAVHAEAFACSERAARRLAWIAARFGLMPIAPEQPVGWGQKMLTLLLTWACNPGRTLGRKQQPVRREFWISATEFRVRYAARPAIPASCVAIAEPTRTVRRQSNRRAGVDTPAA
jgi:hypothetical protein